MSKTERILPCLYTYSNPFACLPSGAVYAPFLVLIRELGAEENALWALIALPTLVRSSLVYIFRIHLKFFPALQV